MEQQVRPEPDVLRSGSSQRRSDDSRKHIRISPATLSFSTFCTSVRDPAVCVRSKQIFLLLLFFFLFFPNLSGNGLLVAAVALGIRRDKQRSGSIQRERERERSSERGLLGSASTTLVLFSLLHYKNSWQTQSRHRQRTWTPARKR